MALAVQRSLAGTRLSAPRAVPKLPSVRRSVRVQASASTNEQVNRPAIAEARIRAAQRCGESTVGKRCSPTHIPGGSSKDLNRCVRLRRLELGRAASRKRLVPARTWAAEDLITPWP